MESYLSILSEIPDPEERAFYQKQVCVWHWSPEWLKRQIDDGLYEKVSMSHDKTRLLKDAAGKADAAAEKFTVFVDLAFENGYTDAVVYHLEKESDER